MLDNALSMNLFHLSLNIVDALIFSSGVSALYAIELQANFLSTSSPASDLVNAMKA